MTALPMTHWQLSAAQIPPELLCEPSDAAFTLPGAEALGDFADLLGSVQENSDDADAPEAVFSLPALFPDALCGPVSLWREIDFGLLRGDHTVLTLDHLAGSGEILLDDAVLARFGAPYAQEALQHAAALTAVPCQLAVDLTDALHLGRRQRLTLRFDDARPAGLCGPICLHTSENAHLSHICIIPDASRRIVTLRVRIHAEKTGLYALLVRPIRADGSAQEARESSLSLEAGQTHDETLSLHVPADVFRPGEAYDAPALRIQLFYWPKSACGPGILCDSALLSYGYRPKTPKSFVPLGQAELSGDPHQLARALALANFPAVSLPAPAPDCVYRALGRAGVSVCVHVPHDAPLRAALQRHGNVFLYDHPLTDSLSLEESAWQLCGSVAFPRVIDAAMTPAELLEDAAGRALNPADEGVREVLSWLRAVLVRLRAEAARQGRFEGALCAPGETADIDVQGALDAALAPVHLSALPLSGAWWTGTRFSAALEAFLPDDLEDGETVYALSVLENEEGEEFARFAAPCAKSGYAGVIEGVLPDTPCVLTLRCALMRGDELLEENALPVYVGCRGPLEAAFL